MVENNWGRGGKGLSGGGKRREKVRGRGQGGGRERKGVTFIRRDFYGLRLTTVRSEARRRDGFVQTRIKCHYAI